MNNTTGANKLWEVAWVYVRNVIDTIREPFLILDENFKVLSANHTFYTFFQVAKSETEEKQVYELGNKQWNIPKLKILLEDILPKNTYFEDFKVEHDFPIIGHKILMLNARQVFSGDVEQPIILLVMEDITREAQLEEQLKNYAEKLSHEVAQKTKELEARVIELESMNKNMVGRELKMVDLKKEIEDLKNVSKKL